MSCPFGTYCPAGSSAATPCLPGYYCPATSILTACPAGSASNATSATSVSTCVTCATASVALGTGSTTCSVCPPGYYCPTTSSQIACPAGTFSNATGATSNSTCLPCSPGYVTLDVVSGSSDDYSISIDVASTVCSPCGAGQYCPGPIVTSQTQCPGGTYSPGALAACLNCTDGAYCPPGSSSQVLVCDLSLCFHALVCVCCARDPYVALLRFLLVQLHSWNARCVSVCLGLVSCGVRVRCWPAHRAVLWRFLRPCWQRRVFSMSLCSVLSGR